VYVYVCKGRAGLAGVEAAAVRQFLQIHGAAFDQPGGPDDTNFVSVLNRTFAMILAREALGEE
jgi:hypothetical protein